MSGHFAFDDDGQQHDQGPVDDSLGALEDAEDFEWPLGHCENPAPDPNETVVDSSVQIVAGDVVRDASTGALSKEVVALFGGSQRAARRLHPAQDVAEGLWYGVDTDQGLVLINSKRQYFKQGQLPEGLSLRHSNLGRSSVSREVAFAWITRTETGSIASALDQLADFYAEHLIVRDSTTFSWLAAWTVGTWCHRAFRLFPYVSIRSAEKRCGKSRLLHLAAKVSFGTAGVITMPTEAQLFRGAERTASAEFHDEVERLTSSKEGFASLINILNVGFERDGFVTRHELVGDKWQPSSHEVYAPRMLAGIKALEDTLEDRALPVIMLRRRKDEKIRRITADTDAWAGKLRKVCALACLEHFNRIQAMTETAAAMLEVLDIDDRAADLWLPLLSIVLAADDEDGGNRSKELIGSVIKVANLRKSGADSDRTVELIDALTVIRNRAGEEITPDNLLRELKTVGGFDRLHTTKGLAKMLNPLGFSRRQLRRNGIRFWAYLLEQDRIDDLRQRYAPDSDGPLA